MPGPSAIPVGTHFSPDVVDLLEYLRAAIRHSGDKAAMAAAVWKPPVRIKAPKKPPTARRESLPLEAGVQYGLLEPKTYAATDLAVELSKLAGDPLYEAFATHVLLKLGGCRVVEA